MDVDSQEDLSAMEENAAAQSIQDEGENAHECEADKSATGEGLGAETISVKEVSRYGLVTLVVCLP